MTQNKKYLTILSIWAVVVMLLPKINFWLSNNDVQITLLNGTKESAYYINWLITYRYITPIAFCITWYLLVSNYEFKKWTFPLLAHSLVGILITFISAGKGMSWVADLSFFITTLIIFFDYKKIVLSVFASFILSIVMAVEWYISVVTKMIGS